MTGLVKRSLKSSTVQCVVVFAGVRSVNKAGEKIMYDLENKINQAVFPGLQGGPHNNTIAGIATAFQQAKTPEFHKYQERV
jgi:glycine hydroxymethyltransferase